MDGVAFVSGVGAVASNAQLQAEHQVLAAVMQKEVISDIGANALKLIQAAVVDTSATGHDLDVRV